MRRFMLDSMVLDALAESQPATAAAIRRIESGEIALLITHVQRDQFAKAPAWKQAAVAEIAFETVDTSSAVWGVSNWGESRWGDAEGSLDAFRTGGRGGIHDALIGSTAAWEGVVLVTNDDDLFKKAAAASVETWRPSRLIEFLLA